MVTVKALRDGEGEQIERPLDLVAQWSATLQSTR
jgi:histidyl-tRNA synthetase